LILVSFLVKNRTEPVLLTPIWGPKQNSFSSWFYTYFHMLGLKAASISSVSSKLLIHWTLWSYVVAKAFPGWQYLHVYCCYCYGFVTIVACMVHGNLFFVLSMFITVDIVSWIDPFQLLTHALYSSRFFSI